MKKTSTILLLTIFVVLSLFLANSAKAVWTKVTLTVTSVQVPLRAIAASLPAGEEFSIVAAYPWVFEIVDSSKKVVSSVTGTNVLSSGVTLSLSVEQDSAMFYTPRLKMSPGKAGGSYINTPNCLQVPSAGLYFVNVRTADNRGGCPPAGLQMMSVPAEYVYFDFSF